MSLPPLLRSGNHTGALYFPVAVWVDDPVAPAGTARSSASASRLSATPATTSPISLRMKRRYHVRAQAPGMLVPNRTGRADRPATAWRHLGRTAGRGRGRDAGWAGGRAGG